MARKIDTRELLSIEDNFFRLDHENKIGYIELFFETPEEIFDGNLGARIPRFNEDFIDRLINLFDLIPTRYSLDISVMFDNLDGYGEEELKEIWKKNILLEARIHTRETKAQNRVALGLCLTGLVFILLSILVGHLWTEESTLRDVVAYILDIIATVPFWGAMDIYFIENRERRNRVRALVRRYKIITFHQKAE